MTPKQKIKSIEKYKFKKGEETHLDHIYMVQGLAGGDWWENKERYSDTVVILRNIEFEIIEYETN